MSKILEKILSVKNSQDKTHKIWTVVGIKFKFKKSKDYSLDSGERQTGETLDKIRKDHTNRYQKALEVIKNHFPDCYKLRGLDIFCGNGYGSHMIASELTNSTILSIDGSREAIEFAKKYYSRDNIYFVRKLFPFKIKKNYYDFAISLESIEHIKDDKRFLIAIRNSLKQNGILILSAPNNRKQDLLKNPNKFHFRHYIPESMSALLEDLGFSVIKIYGQDIYKFNEDGYAYDILNQDDMYLSGDYDKQVCIYIARKIEGK